MTRACVDRYENKENKGGKSGQPYNLCRGALNRALAITRNILLLIDWSIVISYALGKTRGVSSSVYQRLCLESIRRIQYLSFLSYTRIQTGCTIPIPVSNCPILGAQSPTRDPLCLAWMVAWKKPLASDHFSRTKTGPVPISFFFYFFYISFISFNSVSLHSLLSAPVSLRAPS